MSNWLNKSNVSLEVANKGELVAYNNVRVHCYYYGCVQFLLHVLHVHFKMSVEDIRDNTNPKLNGGTGTHVWLHKKFKDELLTKSRFDALDLNNYLGQLKRLRTVADYGYDSITNTEISGAELLTEKIEKILKKHYN